MYSKGTLGSEPEIRQRELTQVYAVSERGIQGQDQRKGDTSGTAHAALVARQRCRRCAVCLRPLDAMVAETAYLLLLENSSKNFVPIFFFFLLTPKAS